MKIVSLKLILYLSGDQAAAHCVSVESASPHVCSCMSLLQAPDQSRGISSDIVRAALQQISGVTIIIVVIMTSIITHKNPTRIPDTTSIPGRRKLSCWSFWCNIFSPDLPKISWPTIVSDDFLSQESPSKQATASRSSKPCPGVWASADGSSWRCGAWDQYRLFAQALSRRTSHGGDQEDHKFTWGIQWVLHQHVQCNKI